MPLETAPQYDSRQLDALDRQAAIIKSVFHGHGYESVEPSILQPAEIFLNRSGEDIRRRMYVFTDPGDRELCLRPDLTIPTCRMYLSRNPEAKSAARFCYNGTAFRYQKKGSTKPAEFLQAGVESIGDRDREQADADVLNVAVTSCKKVGLSDYELRIGDVGLFFALINQLDIPELWRTRLKRYMWQPEEFQSLLLRLSHNNNVDNGGPGSGLLNALSRLDENQARAALSDVLDLAQIDPVGDRTMDEIAERLLNQAAESRSNALPQEIVKLVNDYLKISDCPDSAVTRILELTKRHRINISSALKAFEKRLERIAAHGIESNTMLFDADFGRNMEYYTGFVFELTVPALGENAQIAGGGRYDTLLRNLGAPRDVPAVGCMIRTERLLAAAA